MIRSSITNNLNGEHMVGSVIPHTHSQGSTSSTPHQKTKKSSSLTPQKDALTPEQLNQSLTEAREIYECFHHMVTSVSTVHLEDETALQPSARKNIKQLPAIKDSDKPSAPHRQLSPPSPATSNFISKYANDCLKKYKKSQPTSSVALSNNPQVFFENIKTSLTLLMLKHFFQDEDKQNPLGTLIEDLNNGYHKKILRTLFKNRAFLNDFQIILEEVQKALKNARAANNEATSLFEEEIKNFYLYVAGLLKFVGIPTVSETVATIDAEIKKLKDQIESKRVDYKCLKDSSSQGQRIREEIGNLGAAVIEKQAYIRSLLARFQIFSQSEYQQHVETSVAIQDKLLKILQTPVKVGASPSPTKDVSSFSPFKGNSTHNLSHIPSSGSYDASVVIAGAIEKINSISEAVERPNVEATTDHEASTSSLNSGTLTPPSSISGSSSASINDNTDSMTMENDPVVRELFPPSAVALPPTVAPTPTKKPAAYKTLYEAIRNFRHDSSGFAFSRRFSNNSIPSEAQIVLKEIETLLANPRLNVQKPEEYLPVLKELKIFTYKWLKIDKKHKDNSRTKGIQKLDNFLDIEIARVANELKRPEASEFSTVGLDEKIAKEGRSSAALFSRTPLKKVIEITPSETLFKEITALSQKLTLKEGVRLCEPDFGNYSLRNNDKVHQLSQTLAELKKLKIAIYQWLNIDANQKDNSKTEEVTKLDDWTTSKINEIATILGPNAEQQASVFFANLSKKAAKSPLVETKFASIEHLSSPSPEENLEIFVAKPNKALFIDIKNDYLNLSYLKSLFKKESAGGLFSHRYHSLFSKPSEAQAIIKQIDNILANPNFQVDSPSYFESLQKLQKLSQDWLNLKNKYKDTSRAPAVEKLWRFVSAEIEELLYDRIVKNEAILCEHQLTAAVTETQRLADLEKDITQWIALPPINKGIFAHEKLGARQEHMMQSQTLIARLKFEQSTNSAAL